MNAGEPIAIVGMAGRFPGAGADLDRFWENVRNAVDTSTEVPDGRWRLPKSQCVKSEGPFPDCVPHARGYFLDPFTPDLTSLAIDSGLVGELDPLFHLVLDVGGRAFRNAKMDAVDRRQIGVVFGNICLPTDRSNDLCREILGGRIAEAAGRTPEAATTHRLNRSAAGLPAGLLARALELGGGSFTLDAACASSLYALELASAELRAGRAEAMLAGGCSRPDCQYTQMGFAQLRALSPSGRCSPFDAAADGLMVGEGAGFFVLKRLTDALAHGDRIYGLIAGAGLSNDVSGNLLAPASEGQLRAMRAAYQTAGWTPQDVDLIECHATGTPVGDAVEFESLRELWGESPAVRCVIGSVKSSVGHLLTGAGTAAVMKLLLSMKHKTLPPQANFQSPGASLNFSRSPFRILAKSEAWPERSPGRPRRAAASGFGFGGINAHVLFEEWNGSAATNAKLSAPTQSQRREPNEPIAVVGMAAHVGSWESLREYQERALGRGTDHPPRPKQTGWELTGGPRPAGYFIEELAVPLDRFRIPPKEIEEMLPQQALALMVAAAAMDDVKRSDGHDAAVTPAKAVSDPRSGVILGVTLDPNTTNFHLRWDTIVQSPDLADCASPPLTADRTMGALASVAASRIARTFQFGGPSFTVCSEESSAGRALELAVRALRRKDLDRVLVGGVDLAGDPRAVAAAQTVHPLAADGIATPLDQSPAGAVPADGAAAVVLKRLSDAERDGDRVYAVLRGVGSSVGSTTGATRPDAATYASSLMRALSDGVIEPGSFDYLELAATGSKNDRSEIDAVAAMLSATDRPFPLAVSTTNIGATGAASFLLGFVKSCLAVYQEILPPSPVGADRVDRVLAANPRIHFPTAPRYWLTDKPFDRRAVVAGVGLDGTSCHAVLEEYVKNKPQPVEVRSRPTVERRQPLGARPEAVFAVEYESPAEWASRAQELIDLSARHVSIERLAREWFAKHRPDQRKRRAVTFVARHPEELREQIQTALTALSQDPDAAFPDPHRPEARPNLRDRIFHSPKPLARLGKLAVVFPGSGNQYAGMGQSIGVTWPDLLRRQQAENALLRSQYAPNRFWSDSVPGETTARQFLFGQVTLGTLTSDLLASLGIKPDAMIGLSLGESAGLFGTRTWKSRDEMYRRIQSSNLFGTDLGPPYNAARMHYDLPPGTDVDWIVGVVSGPAAELRSQIKPGQRVYVLIVNTPRECVIGGFREDVERLVEAAGVPFVLLSGVTLAHCEAGRPVERAYRDLHRLPTMPISGLKVYSGAWARSYAATEANAADSITAGLVGPIDVPAVVEAAYRDGVRLFVEVGPGNSATRMIDSILGLRPHLARAITAARQDEVSLVLRTVANLLAERFSVELAALYGRETAVGAHRDRDTPKATLTLPVGLTAKPIPMVLPSGDAEHQPPGQTAPIVISEFPEPPRGWKENDSAVGIYDVASTDTVDDTSVVLSPKPAVRTPLPSKPVPAMPAPAAHFERVAAMAPYVAAAAETQRTTAEAHDLFLKVQANLMATAASALQLHQDLIQRILGGAAPGFVPSSDVPRSLTTEQCFTFARGRIRDVLGPRYAEVDSFPTRVRLPDAELMLVDRILEIDGEPQSLTRGRVVTEHTVHADRWYLDHGVCPTSVTVEAGQADLFLSGFLGIDSRTRGLAVYRLLDAVVTFHRALPKVGETIRYDIHIDEFFNQADAWLFRFRFEGTINGQPMLSMQNGVAGFFTQAALESGKGIIHTALDLAKIPGKRPSDWTDLVPQAATSLSAEQVRALRAGDLAGAFGPEFAGLPLKQPLRLPGGKLRLLDRVPAIEPAGGRFGLGFIRAEYDIDPKDWFLVCHFVDDRVMPGTLMYECCLHTLRVLLMRMGWVGEDHEIVCEPVPGVASRLKCRGQVIESTKVVAYEVSIRELGYGPEPYCIADALMYADGKPIVEIGNMSLRMRGTSREKLASLWSRRDFASRERERPMFSAPVAHAPGSSNNAPGSLKRRAIYDSTKILAFSNGKPSDAFGEPYKIFDRDRVIARLPGPPYQVLDRIVEVTGEPFVLKAGASCVAEYDVPPEAWYFEANRCARMPFSVLLEIALQPCGWLAAYCGSALTSDVDLSFRNLGGEGKQYLAVHPDAGTLSVAVTMTNVSQSAGMIIQHYDMTVRQGDRTVYHGTTYFGFFTKQALANQIGMPTAKVPFPTGDELARAESTVLPKEPPFPAEMLRMVDRIPTFVPDGGSKGLGLVVGTIKVDPEFWFFKAHFYQDPVWPGSLGLESFLQLLKFAAWKRWGAAPASGWQAMALNREHRWTYRGQVIPKDREVTVVLEVTAVDDVRRMLTAQGYLLVDGRIIYQMQNFSLE